MTAHTIADPPHRIHNGETYSAWIRTADGFFVQLHIAGIASQEQADKFMRETAAAPLMLAAATKLEEAETFHANCEECGGEDVPELCEACFPLFDDARCMRRAAIAQATGTTS
jgi:hypothetical protein